MKRKELELIKYFGFGRDAEFMKRISRKRDLPSYLDELRSKSRNKEIEDFDNKLLSDYLDKNITVREPMESIFYMASKESNNPEILLEYMNRNIDTQVPEPLSEKYHFSGYSHEEIPIYPRMQKLEELGDAFGWAFTALMSLGYRSANPKPIDEFPYHNTSNPFKYQLKEKEEGCQIALFSDWGTGYYHSRYIAKHISELNVAQAIHLGDVYYTGTHYEFETRFHQIVDKYFLKNMPFYTMNANHEMMSNGIPLIAYLKKKRDLGGRSGYCKQPQQGTYFCLYNDRYNIIAIDSDFHDVRRYQEKTLRDWLKSLLDEDKINILLTQNPPYKPKEKKETKLYEDLKSIQNFNQKIFLWFWGDVHYCALYEPSNDAPFYGCCIGHGGFSYYVMKRKADAFCPIAGKVIWHENEGRFPKSIGYPFRTHVGNNGFCLMTLEPDRIILEFYDWRRRIRFRKELSP